MIVWVVTGEMGQYSDYSHWVVGLARTLDDAQIMAEAANPKAVEDIGIDRLLRKTRGYERNAAYAIPDTVEPGVTQVQLGTYHDDGEPIYYTAEAFEVKE